MNAWLKAASAVVLLVSALAPAAAMVQAAGSVSSATGSNGWTPSRMRTAMAMMPNGGSLLTLTYYGSEKVVPHYNVMGVAKAAPAHDVLWDEEHWIDDIPMRPVGSSKRIEADDDDDAIQPTSRRPPSPPPGPAPVRSPPSTCRCARWPPPG